MEAKKTKGQRRTKTKAILTLLALTVSLFVALSSIQPVHATTYNYVVSLDCKSDDGHSYWSVASLYGSVRNATQSGVPTTTATTATIGQAYSGGFYYVYRGWIFFDTSSIPDDATIDNATLSIKTTTTLPTTDFNISIQNGQPTYPHIPVVAADYYYAYYSGDGGNMSTSSMSANTYYNISLTSTALDWLDLDSTTKLCLRSDADINYTAPTTVDTLGIYTTEQGQSESPKLYIGYSLDYEFTVNLSGPYNEDGTRDYDGINCTFTRPNQETLAFELNGTYQATAQTDTRLVIISDIGNNYTRVYYLRYDQWYEDIYIFVPNSLYATYYFTLVDYVGVTNGYLESILNINGTDRVIERQRVDVVNDIPFIMSWGTSYKFRLVCDEGTYIWQSIIAGSDTTLTLTVTSTAFPPDSIYIGNITLSATRIADITIQALYDDSAELTDYVYISFTEYPSGTEPIYYTNNTGNTQNITWSDANPTLGYLVYYQINHQEEGVLTYSIVVPQLSEEDNPWDFSWIGDFGEIDTTQIFAVFIVFAVFGGFSIGSVDVGLIATLITAAILIYMGWLDITWAFFAMVFCIAVLVIISIRKSQQGASG